ncbi:MAG: haloacid dehalogenase [Dehalococcoidia bacterium]|nr:haloacid dehalogenase [Dehalococcoidia bacterium]
MADLEDVNNRIHSQLTRWYEARGKAYYHSREIIRRSANAIRSAHRREFDAAGVLLEEARGMLEETHRSIRSVGVGSLAFVGDAEKEYVEACATLALVQGLPFPDPDDLKVSYTAYLKGLGETVGELRRHLLDRLRAGEIAECERLLDVMSDIYDCLVVMDFPDSLTEGLRRTTDMARGILEKTRGDLTMSLRQQSLEKRLADLEHRLER